MDALEKFLGGGQAVAEPPKKSGGQIPSDAQAKREQTALAMIKEELRKNQERAAKGDKEAEINVAALNREIARFEKKSLAAAKAVPAAPVVAAPVAQAVTSDPLEAFLSGKTAPAAQPVAQPTTQPIAQSATAPNAEGGGRGSYQGYSAAEEQAGKVKTKPPMVRQIIGNVLKKGFQAREQVPAFAAAVADIPLSLPQFITSTAAYPVVRAMGGTPEESKQFATSVSAPLEYLKPGKLTGVEETANYVQSLPAQTMKFIGENISKGVDWIAQKTGLSPLDVQAAVDVGMLAAPVVVPKAAKVVTDTAQKIKEQLPTVTIVREQPPVTAGGQSVGAAATPNATMVQQAMSVATPELQNALKNIPIDKINVPTFQRHIEADSLPVPVRLTEGQATADIVKLSQEQNRRGKDTELAYRFNEQNQALVDNIREIRNRAAPDVYGTKTIENSQGVIDAYKQLDNNLTTVIDQNYQNLRDAAGGQFPVDAPVLLQNIQTKLKKQLLSNEAPKGQMAELKRLAKDKSMTFEDYLSLRTNLGEIARTAEKGNERKAASFMIEELEKLPLQKEAASLKPLADKARASARSRFQMLEKDPAFKAAVNDSVPADKFMEKFVINGVNKNIETMVNHLGKDSPARQHMAAGTINWLSDKAGIYGEKPNFSQANYNQALKKLDDVNNIPQIFDAQTASHLKTLGNVAGYTQFQPRGTFVNNSNTLVGSLAEKGKNAIAFGVEKSGNLLVPGLQLGSTVMESRARRAAEAETRKALELGAGTKQTGKNQINNLNNP